jgi:nuclear transcription factor Y gamma
MISGEALSLFAKACELFILDLTMRSWANAEENKRKTLQRSNVAAAVTQCEMFDFLIDIIPRDELTGGGSQTGGNASSGVPLSSSSSSSMPQNPVIRGKPQ